MDSISHPPRQDGTGKNYLTREMVIPGAQNKMLSQVKDRMLNLKSPKKISMDQWQDDDSSWQPEDDYRRLAFLKKRNRVLFAMSRSPLAIEDVVERLFVDDTSKHVARMMLSGETDQERIKASLGGNAPSNKGDLNLLIHETANKLRQNGEL